jgi:ketosteroid isomerase-like protein
MAAALTLLFTPAASPQKEKKKKKDNSSAAVDTSNMIVPLPDEQQIDYTISDMLGAWQIGDVDKMHQDYAEDVSVVSGTWGPPVMGWANYLAAYKTQKARMQQVRMDRSNTYIKVEGGTAWACYQWDFGAVVDGQPSSAQGQTTLVLQKRNNRWVIVHNHTSILQMAQQQGSPNIPAPNQSPAVKPAAAH